MVTETELFEYTDIKALVMVIREDKLIILSLISFYKNDDKFVIQK